MSEESNALAPAVIEDARKRADQTVTLNHRMATSVAALCEEMVVKTAVEISGNKYVPASTWCAIAAAHGCVVGTEKVEFVIPGMESERGGFRAVGTIKDVKTGQMIAQAEGFVGMDEVVWFGGEGEVWSKKDRRLVKKKYPRRSESAIRAMTQTRACGRVCKQAFAHVVVLMDKGLSTTPAEEIATEPEEPDTARSGDGRRTSGNRPQTRRKAPEATETAENAAEAPVGDWRDVKLHWPKGKVGIQLGECSTATLEWYHTNFQANLTAEDRALRAALDQWKAQSEPAEGIPA